MKKLSLIFFTLILLLGSAAAQNKKIEKADSYYKVGEYSKAIKIYTKIYGKLRNKQEKAAVSFKTGMAYWKLQDVNGAVKWLRRAQVYRYQDPMVYFYLGEAYRQKQLYDEAKQFYQTYMELVPDDPRAKIGITSCDLAQQWMEKPTRYNVELVPRINSRSNDFAPAIARSDTSVLYFTTTREATMGKKINSNSGFYFSDIFFSSLDKKGIWTEPKPVEGSINTEMEEGSCSLSSDGSTMYFTRCAVEEGKNLGCQIYVSHLQSGKWSEPEKLEIFADSSISVGQPFISPDGTKLYFVAEHPTRGIGGKDIWVLTRPNKNSRWRAPKILGTDINTTADELFPSVDDKGNLYFASNGRVGMGGFDIYKAYKKDGKTIVENMKYPINSSYNDYGIIFLPGKQRGYLASNRPSGRYDNIYRFWREPLKIILKGYVINDKNHAYITDATVIIEGSDGTQIRAKTGGDGSFTARLKENTDYFLVSQKDGFLKGKASVTTKGITENKNLSVELYMKPINQVVKIPNIRYDFNDTTLRPESKVALDELIDILKLNPNITIEIMAHTDYRGTDKSNLRLSQGRANSVVDYLIKHGVDPKRLEAKGYGETKPFVVDAETAKKYPFLKKGQKLTEQFIKSLPSEEEQEICNELNRRTEFRVLRTDYGENYERFGSPVVDTTNVNTTEPKR